MGYLKELWGIRSEPEAVECDDCHAPVSTGQWRKVVVDRDGSKVLYANFCFTCLDNFNALMAAINWRRG